MASFVAYVSGNIARELKYRSRGAWVALKTAAGLPAHSDRTFYIDSFARALRNGDLPRSYGVLATGKDDGAGSQAQGAMSAIAFAEAFGLDYIHRPFTSVEHAEGDPAAWAQRCEEYFNLGHGALQQADARTTRPVVPIEDFMREPRRWPPDAIVAAQHFQHFCNQDGEAWERVAPRLRACYGANKPPSGKRPFTVALHMRRGDVTATNKKVARSFTPNAVFVKTLSAVRGAIERQGMEPRILLFSQGSEEMFADVSALGCELHLDTPALETHAALVDADVLITSRGGFSYTAAVLSQGIVLYDPQKYRPLQNWIVRNADGSFDAERLAGGLAALRAPAA